MYKYEVTGYASGQNLDAHIKLGTILCVTRHTNETSKDIEVLVWKDRMARGEVAYIDIVELWPPFKCQRIHA